MQARAAHRRNGGEPRAVQQRVSAMPQFGWMPPFAATTFSHAALRLLEDRRVGELRAVELVLVEVGNDFVAVLDQAMGPPSAASGPTWPITRPTEPPEKRASVISATVIRARGTAS